MLSALLAACNNDIFIDDDEFPADLSAEIAGDGGKAGLKIVTRGLQSISLDYSPENDTEVKYFDINGAETTPVIPASELGKIVIESPWRRQTISRNGNELQVSSESNAGNQTYLYLRLKYDFTEILIKVSVDAGRPMEFLQVDYTGGIVSRPSESSAMVHVVQVNNGSSAVQNFVISPWNDPGMIMVEPGAGYPWASRQRLNIEVPYYDAEGWTLREMSDIAPGVPCPFYREDRDMTVPVEIPAHSNVKITDTVTFSIGEISGVMLFRNPVLGTEARVKCKSSTLFPTDYHIEVENL